MMKWQTMETAPKDGTRILVHSNEFYHDSEMAVVYWKELKTYHGIYGNWEVTCFGGHDAESEVEPTHWMPLPEPPDTEKDLATR